MEDEEYKKLPLEDRCVHKLWKARVGAYEEVAKLFRQIDDDKSPEFSKYLGLIKKFVLDSNAMGQEKGLEATLAFVENYAHAGKTVGEVISGIVSKCIAAPKTKTRELALQVILMYIEIEKHEAVQEELIKGMDSKNPKVVAACINACTTALREYGSKVITLKPLVKKITPLFGERDKSVRDEARLMVIEMYRWIGPALRSQLANLQPVQIAELEVEFGKIDGQKAVPTRFLRSQQQKQAKMVAESVEVEGVEEDEETEDAPAVDPYDLADPVDILSKLPKDFHEKLEAKKWQERKEVLELLENLVKTPKLENGEYGDLVRALKKVIQKDSNVLVVALAARCLAHLATGLKKRFQPYALTCIPAFLEKFKEKKQNVVLALRDAIDAAYQTTNIEVMLEDVVEALNNKNPSVKSETALFLARSFTKTSPTVLNKKVLKALSTALIKNINEPDPTVRDCSAEALGTLMKLVGEKAIGPFLVELEKDNLKMTKIKECCDKAVITVKVASKKERPTTAPNKAGGEPVKNGTAPKAVKRPPGSAPVKKKAAGVTSGTATIVKSKGLVKTASADSLDQPDEDEDTPPETGATNSQDTQTRIDISPQITESLISELSDKNWKVRNEALIKVAAIISDAKLIKPNIGDLPQALALRLVDSNSKIAQAAFNVCESIANAMGPPCKQHVRVLFPGLLQGLGDNKSWIRAASLTAINTFGEQCAYKEFFEGEMIADALKTGSPTLRSELWTWLAEKLPKLKSVPKEELMICIPHLYSNLEDRNADVRKNAQEAVLGVMMHLSYESMLKQTEKLKPGSKAVVVAGLDKARPNLPVKPLPKKQPSQAENGDKAVRGTKPVTNSKNAVKKNSAGNKQAASRKKDDDVDTSPLLASNNMKHQRTIDESKLRVLKWNFTTPREEFVELLKEQMGAANVNKTLIFNMFHSDFRYHIKALESLTEDLPDNSTALICNLDLILKWLTLRFFDTNPSVLLKGLEYLHTVFNMLIENKYHMLENEASSFIPYLILKIGDPKDSVRNGVRSLFKQICHIYSVSRLFSYIMEGLKSKNARQRAECLEVMGSIIEDYGITICLPSPAACLKEVAKQISDRDNAVRSAALNCVVQAHYIVGEKVFKMVGQISDKDMSLLEERIKRASKKPPPSRIQRPETVGSPQREIASSPVKAQEMPQDDEDEEEEDNIPQIQITATEPALEEKIPEYFKLDPDLMRKLDSIDASVPKRHLQEFDLGFLKEKIVVPSITDTKARATPLSPPKPIIPNQLLTRRSTDKMNNPCGVQDFMLEKTIKQMASADLTIALKAIMQVQEILQGAKYLAVVDYEDNFMSAITMQLKLLHPHNPQTHNNARRVYKGIMMVMDHFYLRSLGQKVSVDVLKDIMKEFIILLVENKLGSCADGEAFVRVVNLHCVKLIEKSDHTNIICALVRLLHNCIDKEPSPRLTDLVMKCLWRVIKLMPSWADDIDYDSVFLEVHIFLRDFPTIWWKNKSNDTPLRTIKTILHSSTKFKGGAVMLHLGKIANTNESEMESYILRVLKSLKIEEVKQVPLKTEAPRRSLSRVTHTQLTDIFQKIGNKDETKEGLNLLYDFLQQNPEADIEPFLKKSSSFFQDYIKKGLQEIEDARNSNSTEKTDERAAETVNNTPSEESVNGEPSAETIANRERGPDYYLQRLQRFNKLWDETLAKKSDN